MTEQTDDEQTDYERGRELGRDVAEMRRAGDADYDPRWDFADEAKKGRETFAEFRRGFDAGYAEVER